MQLPDSYQKCLSVEQDKLILIPPGQSLDVRAIRRGILFILARWSGASLLAFQALQEALATIADLDAFRLSIADTDDEATQALIASLGEVPGGHGETYWVFDGKVMHRLAGYDEKATRTLQEYMRRILREE